MPQRRTLVSQTVAINGRGLFTGEHTSVIIAPASAGGILFQRRDLPGRPSVEAVIANVAKDPAHAGLPKNFPARNTILVSPDDPACVVLTVEHIMSALGALGVTDAIIAVEGPEIPILDGGAADFAANILHIGLGAIGWVEPITLPREVVVEDGRGGKIVGQPTSDPVAEFTYELEYGPGSPIHPQTASWAGDVGVYLGQVAPARTFCLRAEAEAMKAAGLFKDFSPSDLLVFDDDGSPIENAMRFHDEPARHKLLDLIGDLALLGGPLLANVTATRSGHALTHAFCRAVLEARGGLGSERW